jgi:2-polyprenyl-6-hydroxyphenyl methylase/3-demethylubiquinone-9 3-methyltransferase
MGTRAVAERRFAFGRNWQSFLTTVDEPRIERAVASLERLVGDLTGRTVLDVGCGSGLFSLAACRLGAASVVAFDLDPDSVAAAVTLRSQAGIPPARWAIHQGSALDAEFLASLAPADVVYAWGVLHHTGAMWRAIDLVTGRVAPGGTLVLAIYNRRGGLLGSRAAWWLKQFYHRLPPVGQRALEAAYLAQWRIRPGGRATLRAYASGPARGMDPRHDIRDWLGGLPYEYATVAEVRCAMERIGFHLERVAPSRGLGCNEFVFTRDAPTGALPSRRDDPMGARTG